MGEMGKSGLNSILSYVTVTVQGAGLYEVFTDKAATPDVHSEERYGKPSCNKTKSLNR
jgi:hypothetical protein